MKSPFTGKEMTRVYERRTWNFRGEGFEYMHVSWRCEDTGEMFTTDESDTAGFIQVTNQYRDKYGIPYTDEIIEVRRKYGISAAKMSQILGIGVNQFRLYEQGEVPNVSNGRMIRSIMNPKVMLQMVESSENELSKNEYMKIVKRVKELLIDEVSENIEKYERSRVFAGHRGIENGYAPVSLERLKNIMLFILDRCGDVWCTKMNKLLFYIDFLSYRERGMAMTGLTYKAIEFGPVPERWDRVYSEFSEIHQELKQAGEFVGSALRSDVPADVSVFSDNELKIMEQVCSKFETSSSRDISKLSHEEAAWINHYETYSRIPFVEAFALKAV